ncbi:hypothetical protein ABFV47_01390 [Mycolicibacterium fortuitum]|uniref:hypothetical protein n=1 Tax=Mycolicibacterium fortuitum TaxID=1766 RepID=UPI003A88503C
MNELEQAALAAAREGGPERVWDVGPEADVEFNDQPGGHVFDGLVITHWSVDE